MSTDQFNIIIALSRLITGILILLYLYNIIQLKFISEEIKLKYEKMINKYSTLYLYFAFVLVIYNTIRIIYILNNPTIDESIDWSNKDKEQLINEMKVASNSYYIKFPTLTQKYINCCVDNVMTKLSKKEYLTILKLSQDKKTQKIELIIKDCIFDFKQGLLDSTLDERKNVIDTITSKVR
jgi:hypothetical protein